MRPDVSHSIAELDDVLHNYEAREDVLGRRITEKTAEARRLGTAAKRAAGAERMALRRQAIMCLKSKGQVEDQLNKTVARHLALEGQRHALEDATLTADALESLRTSSRVLEAHGRILDMRKVTSLLDRLESQMESATEIGDAFSEHPSSMPSVAVDDPDIESQLDELLVEESVELMPTPGVVHAPSVRNHMGAEEEDVPATRPLLAPHDGTEFSTRLHMAMA